MSASCFAQNTVCFTITSNPDSNDSALSPFTKYINIWGFGIYAEPNVTDEKVLHTAAIFAELMDNDEDGTADNSTVLSELTSRDGLMPVFEYDGSRGMNTFMNNYQGNGASAVLWAPEIHPEGSTPSNGFDITLEEIMHTIHHVGYGNAYPTVFGEQAGTDLTNAMDLARGGHFTSIPNPYPDSAWYHYDDVTCDYGCMAIEYFYWANSSLMGAQNFPWRCQEIEVEWELCDPDSFEATDVAMHSLLTNATYKFPQSAPDGNYCPGTTGMEHQPGKKKVTVYPNPTLGSRLFIRGANVATHVQIIDLNGQLITSTLSTSESFEILLPNKAPGIYFLRIGEEVHRFVKL